MKKIGISSKIDQKVRFPQSGANQLIKPEIQCDRLHTVHEGWNQTVALSSHTSSPAQQAELITQAKSEGTLHAKHLLNHLHWRYGNRYVQRVIRIAKRRQDKPEVNPEVEHAIQQKRGSTQLTDAITPIRPKGMGGFKKQQLNLHWKTPLTLMSSGRKVEDSIQSHRAYDIMALQHSIQTSFIRNRTGSVLTIQRQPAITSFSRRVPLFRSTTVRRRIGRLQRGRRVTILTRARSRYRVRVESGPLRNRVGYIRVRHLVIPQARKLTFPGRVRLVFFQNPERIGSTVASVRVGLTRFSTWLLRMASGGRLRRLFKIRAGKPVYLRASGHTAKYFYVQVRNRLGYVKRSHVRSDITKRRRERKYYVSVAKRFARRRRSIYVDPRNQTCINRPYPIEFFTANDILRSIVGAGNCTSALVDEIRIVSHGGTHGIPETGDFHHMYGLYLRRFSSWISPGGMTTRQFARRVRNYLAGGVNVWLHACKTAEQYRPGQPGFAEQLAIELHSSGLSQARVRGMTGIGPVTRRGPWKIYP